MSRATFKNTLRADIKIRRVGRVTEVSGAGLTYRTARANSATAAYLNSKIPVITISHPNISLKNI